MQMSLNETLSYIYLLRNVSKNILIVILQ